MSPSSWSAWKSREAPKSKSLISGFQGHSPSFITSQLQDSRFNTACIIWGLSPLALAEWPVLTYWESLTPLSAVALNTGLLSSSTPHSQPFVIWKFCYNEAIRLATGFQIWTPLPILRREAGVSCLTNRLRFLTKAFLLRLLWPDPFGLWLADCTRSDSSSPDLSEDSTLSLVSSFEKTSPHGFIFQDTYLPDAASMSAWKEWCSNTSI